MIIFSSLHRVLFNDLPETAKSPNVAAALGGLIESDSGQLIEVCGSPGEVGNDPSLGHNYLLQKFGDAEIEHPDGLDQNHERWHSSKMVWNTVTLSAQDQLRQRVAWALSSIFVVTENDIGLEDNAEAWSNYYDIFVRNSFGQFFDVLKEVSFSPMMGRMLTFEGEKRFSVILFIAASLSLTQFFIISQSNLIFTTGSKSLAYQVERNGAFLYPDENFARVRSS